MPLTPQEQAELDQLEYDKLLAEKSAAEKDSELKKLESNAARPAEPESTLDKAKNIAADVAIRSSGSALGQAAGAATGPFGVVAVPVLGGIGGMVSEYAANSREGRPTTIGNLASSAISGAVPGGSLYKAGAKKVATEAAKYAAGNLAGKTAETLIDQGRLPDIAEAGISAGAGALGAPVAKVLSKATEVGGKAIYALRDAAFKAVRKEGVVVPPHLLGDSADALTSVAGPTSIQTEAAQRNIFAWQKMAREAVGLPKEALPIQPRNPEAGITGDLAQIREKAAEPYQAIKAIQEDAKTNLAALKSKFPVGKSAPDMANYEAALSSPEAQKWAIQAGADVDNLKVLRDKAHDALDRMKKGDPNAYGEWQANKNAAESLESQIEVAAATAGDSTLLKRLREARETIAKTYAVESATNKTTGLIDPADLAAQFNNGVPLTGNLKKIADFANAFDKASVDASMIRNPNVGKITALGAANQASRGDIPGLLGAAVTMTVGKPLRKVLLSDFIQNATLSPKERQNFAAAMGRFIAENSPESRRVLNRVASAQSEESSP